MMNLLSKKTLVLFGILILLATILVVTSFTSVNNQQPVVTPSPQPINRDNPLQKTVPGKTTRSQFLQTVSVTQKKELSAEKTEFLYESSSPIRPNQVIVKENVVEFEKIIVPLGKQESGFVNLEQYLALYGRPEKEVPGSLLYGPAVSLYLYSSKGIAVVGNSYTNTVFEIHKFVPITETEYLRTYGQDFGEESHTEGPL